MSWYDYIPVVGSVARAAQGDWEQAAADLSPFARVGYDIHQANNKQRTGFYDAAKQSEELAGKQRAFQMEGLDRALGFYQPAKDRMRAAYGDPGSVRR